MTGLLLSLGISLAVTLLLELGAALLLGLRHRDLLLVALVNILTNPLVVLVLNLASPAPWYLVALLELAAVAAEGLLYQKGLEYRRIHPFLLSIIFNAISYFGGLLL